MSRDQQKNNTNTSYKLVGQELEKVFPERIFGLRKKLRLSQEALADVVGVTQRQISNYESGDNEPTARILVALADALNTTSDYIIGLSNTPERPLSTDHIGPEAHLAAEIVQTLPEADRQRAISLLESLAISLRVHR